jgi:hypothetical protein
MKEAICFLFIHALTITAIAFPKKKLPQFTGDLNGNSYTDLVIAGRTNYTDNEGATREQNRNDTTAYALLYVYRPGQFYGAATAYNLHIGDSVVCRVKNNSKCIIKLFHEGPTKIWAKFPSRYEVELMVKFGENYYLSCGVNASFMAIRDEGVGQKEFEMVKGRKNND